VALEEREDLLGKTRQAVERAFGGLEHYAEFGDINSRIRDSVSKLLYDETRRRPMVLTVTVEV
jgi:mRNA degradation ribonuclease J1/J2